MQTLKIKYIRPPWIADVEKANRVIDAARAAVLQPDKFHIDRLAQAIKEAEGIPVVCAWCEAAAGEASGPGVSHGICPTHAREFMEEAGL